MKPGRVYRVKWRDATDLNPGEWVTDMPDPECIVDTVGVLIRSTTTHHVFAHTVTRHDGARRGEFAIPRSAVLSKRRLVDA